MDKELLKTLCSLPGVSGCEDAVAQWLLAHLGKTGRCFRDSLGNVIVQKEGPGSGNVLVSAPMDEAGFLLSRVQDSGLFSFTCIGDMDPRVILGKGVLAVRAQLPGVIGAKAVHQQTKEERDTPVPADKLYLNFGAGSREEALGVLCAGDAVVFESAFHQLGKHRVCGRAMEQRSACAVLIELLEEARAGFTAVFTTQSLTTGIGLPAAAYAHQPDVCLMLGPVPAADVPGAPGEGCRLAGGAVLPQMDKGVFYSRRLLQSAKEISQSFSIPVQPQEEPLSQKEAQRTAGCREGIELLRIGIPCRYSASPAALADLRDMDAAKALALELLRGHRDRKESIH